MPVFLPAAALAVFPSSSDIRLNPDTPFRRLRRFCVLNGAVKEGLFRGGEMRIKIRKRRRVRVKEYSLTLDHSGSFRTTISDLPNFGELSTS
jgi:hypothetical protein